MYRGIVYGRPKPIILVTVWIACAPAIVTLLGVSLFGIVQGFLPAIFFLIFAVIPGSILFQVTRNFITIPKPKLDD